MSTDLRVRSAVRMVAMLALVALASLARGAQTPPAPRGNAQNGAKLFVKYGCYECHGREGQGGMAGPRIAPNAPPLVTLIKYVRAPSGEMPPYTEKLLKSDQDLVDIYAFLTSRAPANPERAPR